MADFTGYKESPNDSQEVDEYGNDPKSRRFTQLKLLMAKAKPILKNELLKPHEKDRELTDEEKQMFRDLQTEK